MSNGEPTPDFVRPDLDKERRQHVRSNCRSQAQGQPVFMPEQNAVSHLISIKFYRILIECGTSRRSRTVIRSYQLLVLPLNDRSWWPVPESNWCLRRERALSWTTWLTGHSCRVSRQPKLFEFHTPKGCQKWLAEMERFELSKRFSPLARLAGGCIRPTMLHLLIRNCRSFL